MSDHQLFLGFVHVGAEHALGGERATIGGADGVVLASAHALIFFGHFRAVGRDVIHGAFRHCGLAGT